MVSLCVGVVLTCAWRACCAASLLARFQVYYIYYGTWSSDSIRILTDFGNNLGGTPWYNVLTTFTDSNGVPLSNDLALVQSVQVNPP